MLLEIKQLGGQPPGSRQSFGKKGTLEKEFAREFESILEFWNHPKGKEE